MDRQQGKGRAEQHYAARAKVQIAGAANFALASDGRTDLLHDVRYQAGLFRIDFRYRAFELDRDVGRRAGGDWLAQDDAQIVA